MSDFRESSKKELICWERKIRPRFIRRIFVCAQKEVKVGEGKEEVFNGSPCPFTKVGNFFWKSPKIRFDFVV